MKSLRLPVAALAALALAGTACGAEPSDERAVPPMAQAGASEPSSANAGLASGLSESEGSVADEVEPVALEEIEQIARDASERSDLALGPNDSGFWVTVWTESTSNGEFVFCVGDPNGGSCHHDGAHEMEEPILLLSSGTSPNGAVLLISGDVEQMVVSIDGSETSSLPLTDVGLPSGRLLSAFGAAAGAGQATVSGELSSGETFSTELALTVTAPPIYPLPADHDGAATEAVNSGDSPAISQHGPVGD